MLQTTEMHEQTDQQTIDFYVQNYPEVEVVACDSCKQDMCLWYLDPKMAGRFSQMHHRGMQRVTLSGALLATRKRLDGHMGYQCICGNDSRLGSAEVGIVPVLKRDASGQVVNPDESLEVYPHHEAAVKLIMARDGDRTKIEDLKGGEQVIDGFIHRRLK